MGNQIIQLLSFFPGKDIIEHAIEFNIPIFAGLRNLLQALVSHYYYFIKHDVNTKTTYGPGQYFGPAKIESSYNLKKFILQHTLPRSIKFINARLSINEQQVKVNNLSISNFHHQQLANDKGNFYNKLNTFLRKYSDKKKSLIYLTLRHQRIII